MTDIGATIRCGAAVFLLATFSLPAADHSETRRDSKTADRKEKVTINGETFTIPTDPLEGSANALLLKKFDLNGDGKIDDVEIAAAQKTVATNKVPRVPLTDSGRRITTKDLYEGNYYEKKKPVPVTSGDDFLRRYDVNRDGTIDASEYEMIKRDLEGPRAAPSQPRSPSPAAPPAQLKEPMPIDRGKIR
jgi:hypothetical protein